MSVDRITHDLWPEIPHLMRAEIEDIANCNNADPDRAVLILLQMGIELYDDINSLPNEEIFKEWLEMTARRLEYRHEDDVIDPETTEVAVRNITTLKLWKSRKQQDTASTVAPAESGETAHESSTPQLTE